MISRSDLLRLRRELRATKTLSVYLADNHDGFTGHAAGLRTLAHAIADTREALRMAPAGERADFERAAEHAEEWVAATLEHTPTGGLIAFVTVDGVRYGMASPLPGPTLVAWGEGISLGPGLPMVDRVPPVAVAVVDAQSAHLYTRHDGTLLDVEVLHVDARPAPTSHMGTPPRQGFHPGMRGTTAADAAHRTKQADQTRLVRMTADRLPPWVVSCLAKWPFPSP